MFNFISLDIDSSLQTNDSKWLNSSCDSTRPSHDSTLTRLEKNFRWLWLKVIHICSWKANNGCCKNRFLIEYKHGAALIVV